MSINGMGRTIAYGHDVLYFHRVVLTPSTASRLATEVSTPTTSQKIYVIKGMTAHENSLTYVFTFASLDALIPRVYTWRRSTIIVPTTSGSTATDFATAVRCTG